MGAPRASTKNFAPPQRCHNGMTLTCHFFSAGLTDRGVHLKKKVKMVQVRRQNKKSLLSLLSKRAVKRATGDEVGGFSRACHTDDLYFGGGSSTRPVAGACVGCVSRDDTAWQRCHVFIRP